MFTFLIIYYVFAFFFGLIVLRMKLTGLPTVLLFIGYFIKDASGALVSFWSLYSVLKLYGII